MSIILKSWKKPTVIVALATILPLSVMAAARLPEPPPPGACSGPVHPGHGPLPPPHEMGRSALPPGMLPPLPFLRGIELTEEQQDKVFELTTANLATERARYKAARKAMEELHRLAASGAFDAARARELAATHSQAMGDLLVLRAETEAKVRALLTPEQRRQLETGESGGPRPRR